MNNELMVLYHVTPSINLKSIFILGLYPSYKKGITTVKIEPKVWLTDNPNFILTEQCGDKWIKRNKPSILKIYCEGLIIYPKIVHCSKDYTICPHEYFTYNPISINRISFIDINSII